MFRSYAQGIYDLVYPPSCYLCRQARIALYPREILCLNCRGLIVPNRPPFCLNCSRHLLSPSPAARCRNCQRHDYNFDFAWGACLYEDTLKKLLWDFKYHQKAYLCKLFNTLIKDFITANQFDVAQFDSIVPIPLHPARHRERGYNQAELLARGVASAAGIPLINNGLIRIRNTPSQANLRQKERWTNMAMAFRMNYSKGVQGKTLLLIDDLLTTGATASEAAGILKAAGATTVGVLTLAIAPE